MPSQNYCIEISGLKSNFSFTATNPSNGTTNAGCTNYPNGYWLEQGVGNNAARRIMGWGQTGISTYGWMLTNSETQSCVIRNSLAPYNSNTPPSVFDLNSDFSTSSQPAYVTPGTCSTMVPGYMLTITIIYPGGNQSSESTGEMYPVARINGKPFYTNAEKCASVYYSDSDGRWLYTGRYGARGLTIPNGMVISVVGPSESDVFPLTGWNAYSNQANTSGYVSTTTTQATIPEVLVDYICLSGGGTYEPGIEGPYFSTDSSGGNYYRLDGTLGNMQGANCGPVLNKTGNILTLTANGFVWEGNLNSLSLEPVLSFGEQFGNRTNVSFYLNQCGPPTTPFPTLIQPYCVSGAGAWAFNGTYTKISANSGYSELWQKVDNPNMFIGLNLTTNMWYMFNSIAGNYYIHNNLENSLTPPLVGWHSISGSLQVPEISSGTCVTPTPTPTPTPTLSPCLAPANTNNGPFFFPTTKATNDIYSFAGRAWYWNNYAWHRYCMSTTSTLNAYFVSGAGSAQVNGKYIYNSSSNQWKKVSNQNIHLFYQAGYYPMWVIIDTTQNVTLYHNYNSSSQTPPLTGWEVDSGTSPAPTIE